MPDAIGKKLLAARGSIRQAGLVTAFKRVPNDSPKGTVVSQFPKPGTTAKRGAQVLLNVSLGPTPTPGAQSVVPDVTGQDEATATQDLQCRRVSGLGPAAEDIADPAEDGFVVNQEPACGRSCACQIQDNYLRGPLRRLKEEFMGLGVSLILIAVGAILTWAVDAQVSGLDVTAVGVILMIVGLIGGLFSLAFWSSWWGPGYAAQRVTAGGPTTVRRHRCRDGTRSSKSRPPRSKKSSKVR